MEPISLNGNPLTLEEIRQVARDFAPVELSEAARGRIVASRSVVESILRTGRTIYGVNTGFGKLADVGIAPEHLAQLQTNLVRSHACGLGEPLREAESRAMLLLRANVLAKGFSGVRVELVELLMAMLNHRVHPVIPSRG